MRAENLPRRAIILRRFTTRAASIWHAACSDSLMSTDSIAATSPDADPIARFRDSFTKAVWRSPETGNACVLATVNAEGFPAARVVLLKNFDDRGFVFFTNLLSRKAQDLRQNPRASLVFFWPDFGEQVRIEGVVEVADDVEADAYFATRPRLSQLGAWASEQSQSLPSREALVDRVTTLSREFDGVPIPRPPHWGGLRLTPRRIEFWNAEPHRLHDRDLYERMESGWLKSLLYP